LQTLQFLTFSKTKLDSLELWKFFLCKIDRKLR